jgi:hypothetical protein
MTASSFQQTLALTRTLAAELKASLEVLQVVSGSRRLDASSQVPGLAEDVPIQRVRGNLVSRVSQILQTDDLLVLTHNAHPEFLGVPTLGVAPEAIARQHPDVSIIIAHFPRQRELLKPIT